MAKVTQDQAPTELFINSFVYLQDYELKVKNNRVCTMRRYLQNYL